MLSSMNEVYLRRPLAEGKYYNIRSGIYASSVGRVQTLRSSSYNSDRYSLLSFDGIELDRSSIPSVDLYFLSTSPVRSSTQLPWPCFISPFPSFFTLIQSFLIPCLRLFPMTSLPRIPSLVAALRSRLCLRKTFLTISLHDYIATLALALLCA
jgi:hypothetical protein